MANNFEISYKQELIRKGIHLCSLSIPIGYSLLDQTTALWILAPLTLLVVSVDLAIKIIQPLKEFVIKYFGAIMRPHEVKNEIVLNGASWVLISACICIVLLPKICAVCGFTVLILSDTAAALLGKKYGKHKWFVNKSVEGTLAFIVTAIAAVVFIGILNQAPWQYYILVAFASVCAGMVEAVSGILKIDDNLSIPLSLGFIMWGGSILINDLYGISIIHLL
jgi:dolichol kinase